MMISPEAYIDRFKGAEYLDLITERDRLIRFIKEYEEKDIAGDRSGKEWGIYPQPDVRYQVYLEYLSRLCVLMSKKYNEEYVWETVHCTMMRRTKKKCREGLVYVQIYCI